MKQFSHRNGLIARSCSSNYMLCVKTNFDTYGSENNNKMSFEQYIVMMEHTSLAGCTC